jgi:23S rRNA (uracil1939-C5)-methyltransferase
METLTIARVGGQGDGIAQTPGGPVFAPLTLPGETVRGETVATAAPRASRS